MVCSRSCIKIYMIVYCLRVADLSCVDGDNFGILHCGYVGMWVFFSFSKLLYSVNICPSCYIFFKIHFFSFFFFFFLYFHICFSSNSNLPLRSFVQNRERKEKKKNETSPILHQVYPNLYFFILHVENYKIEKS